MADLQTIPVVAPLVLPVAQPPSPTSVQPPMSQPPPLPEAPLGDAGQKRALEEDEAQKRALLDEEDAGKRKARRVQVKNKCEHGCWKDGRCKDCLCKHKVKRGDCKDGCNEVILSRPLPTRSHAARISCALSARMNDACMDGPTCVCAVLEDLLHPRSAEARLQGMFPKFLLRARAQEAQVS